MLLTTIHLCTFSLLGYTCSCIGFKVSITKLINQWIGYVLKVKWQHIKQIQEWIHFHQTKHKNSKAKECFQGWISLANHKSCTYWYQAKNTPGWVTCDPRLTTIITGSWWVAKTDTLSSLADQGSVCGPWNDRCMHHLHPRSSLCDPNRTSSVSALKAATHAHKPAFIFPFDINTGEKR